MPHDHHDHDHEGHGHVHSHEGLSPSGHPYRADNDGPLSYWQTMEIAIRELMIEKGIVTAEEVAQRIDAMDRRSPADGAKVVARAWTDPAFHDRLMQDASAACTEMGFAMDGLKLIAVENTDEVHNVVVCTLCSCYPRNLLGLPPDWYKTRAYRSRTVREPRAVLAEFGVTLPDEVTIRVHDSTAPAGTEGLDEIALAALVTRDSMIGTGLPLAPAAG